MTYTSGQLIQATDYNGFVSTNASANLNAIEGTATSLGGYGYANVATVSTSGTITATQWATLVNNITTVANHQGTSITARTAPVAGNTISILSNLNTDLTTLYTNRANASASGTQFTAWTGTASKTAATGAGAAAWTITFTDTITFANSTALYSFFNSGGYLKAQWGKTSTGTVADTEWNAFIGAGGAGGVVANAVILTGAAASKTIAGLTLTGTTIRGGTGTPTTAATSTGVYALTTTAATLYKQFDTGTAYSSNYLQVTGNVNSNTSPTIVTLTTTWYDNGDANPGSTAAISGGTATSGISFGTAPTTIVTAFPPETTYLANNWGSITIASTVA